LVLSVPPESGPGRVEDALQGGKPMRCERSLTVTVILWTAAAAAGLGFVVGCSSGTETSSAPPPATTAPAPKVPAAGPAISSPVSFDQLALETPVKRVKGKNGLVFLRFAYADNDGRIYNCELPEPMSKGEYTPQEWVRTFNIYRLPKVIGQKKVAKKGPRVIGDFPFISPRPQTVQAPAAQPRQTPAQEPIQMPALPPISSQSPPPPPVPARPMPNLPSVSPRPPSTH